MEKELFQNIQCEQKPGSEVTCTGELPFSEIEKYKKSAVEAIGKDIVIDGFRKGHVPENVLLKTVGEMAILHEMAERALSKFYPLLVEHHGLDVIGYPKITITKIAPGNPLGFTITVAVVPPVTLPDYEQIAKEVNAKKESKDVTDEEVTMQIKDVLRQKAAYERLQKNAESKEKQATTEAPETNKKHVSDIVEDSNTGDANEVQDFNMPELTDDFVKTLGQPGQFENVADFKAKMKEHLSIEKARTVDSTHRAKITDAIIEKTIVEIPQVLIDAEIGQMFAQMENDLTRAQLTIEDYLGHIKKTKEDLSKEWTPSAEKRAKLQLVLNAIAKQANIEADSSLIEQEVSRLLMQYKDADKKRVRIYVTSVLTNEAVMKKLEGLTN